MTKKRPHWTQTPEGKRKPRRSLKASWKLRKAGTTNRPKRKRKPKTPTIPLITPDQVKMLQDLKEQVAESVRPKVLIWTTGSGEQIPVTEMEEGHLRNAISLLARRLITQLSATTWMHDVKTRVEALAAMLNEAERRGLSV